MTSTVSHLRAAHCSAIVNAWGAARAAIVDVGGALIAAKADLPHGAFMAMVRDDLPFSVRTAQKLMIIADDPRLSNASPGTHLPTGWTVLYELSQLDDAAFSDAVDAGAITADMTKAAARRLVVGQAEANTPPPAQQFSGCRIDDLRAAIAAGLRAALILGDFPWTYETYSDAGADKAPQRHYDTMSIDELMAFCALIDQLAADNAVLVLWAYDPLLDHIQPLMAAAGFTFKTRLFDWVKTEPLKPGDVQDPTAPVGKRWALGQGKHTRAQTEIALVGTRGPGPWRNPWAGDVRQLIVADVNDHSSKPLEVYDRMERLYPGPWLELFARTDIHGHRPGWMQWGNQSDAATFAAKVKEAAA